MPTLAKLTRPKAHRILLRNGLFTQLDEACERPLVWVHGTPGAGKSTLVASFVGERKLRNAWYHVDAGDADVGTFFYYLAQAVPAPRKSATSALPLLTPECRVDLAGFSRHFFRQFFERVSCLVLDNYHDLPEDSAVHAVLDQAVFEVPSGATVVVISRGAPPASLLHHTLAGRLGEVDGTALRVTLDETRAIAALRGAPDDATVRRVHELSGGWAAGVALALQRVGRGDGGTLGTHEAAEVLFEFFARQVLEAMPPAQRSFLQRSALLPVMTGEMTDALLGCEDSESQFEQLYRRGLFTDRRNTHPRSYQYHDLFRAFLLRRHAGDGTAAERALLARRAGELLLHAGQPGAAIRLLLEAEDWAAAAQAIPGAAREVIPQGRDASVREWIAALPPTLVQQDPSLGFWLGMSLVRSEPVAARVGFERAARQFAALGVKRGHALGCAAVILSYMYEFRDVNPLDPWIDELLEVLRAGAELEGATETLLVERALLFALSFRRPERVELEACIARILALIAGDVSDDDAAMACGVLIIHYYSIGDLVGGAQVARRLEALLAHGQLAPVTRALCLIQLGHFADKRGDLDGAEQRFQRTQALLEQHAIALPVARVNAHLGLAFCALERDDLKAAESHLEIVMGWGQPIRRTDAFAAARLRFWLACRKRRWAQAQEYASRQLESAAASGVFWMLFESQVEWAIVSIELERDEEAERALEPLAARLRGTAYEHLLYVVDLVRAYRALRRGDLPACHAWLRAGLPGSRHDEAKFTLRMQPDLLARLCAAALAAGIESEYVADVIRTLRLRPPAAEPVEWPWPFRVHTLGRFEVVRDGRPLEYSRKAPKKTLAVLKAIIAFGGAGVREQRVVDAFWPDEEGDTAIKSLGAALHRLRTLLGDPDVIVQHGGTLSLNPGKVWVDLRAFDALVGRPAQERTAEALLDLYRGAFLPEDDGEPWSVAMRERLRGRFIHAIGEVGTRLEGAGQHEAAIACYLRGLDADPMIEPFYQGLMRCYAQLDRLTEALSAYHRLKRLLSISLGVAPSAQTERLHAALRRSARRPDEFANP
ncbi:MAG TPA: BTAD domain-containing putative transcriptional regulator [Steroidobacteraceae bacterium]|nr:BTAD domain-containing putative transcriptional regulator [Steroidobacteraceae bacterium]